jgi:hypothetical protein
MNASAHVVMPGHAGRVRALALNALMVLAMMLTVTGLTAEPAAADPADVWDPLCQHLDPGTGLPEGETVPDAEDEAPDGTTDTDGDGEPDDADGETDPDDDPVCGEDEEGDDGGGGLPPPLKDGKQCSTNSIDPTIPNTSTPPIRSELRCIAGYGMKTRGWLHKNCLDLTDRLADVRRTRNYQTQPCSTRKSVEMVAQSRLIYRINTSPNLRAAMGMGDLGELENPLGTGVSSDIQWENELPIFELRNGILKRIRYRPDLFVYDSTSDPYPLDPEDSAGDIWIGEVKLWDNDDRKTVRSQISKYTTWIDNGTAYDAETVDFAQYRDGFRYGCGPDAAVYYVVPDDGSRTGGNGPVPGALMVWDSRYMPQNLKDQYNVDSIDIRPLATDQVTLAGEQAMSCPAALSFDGPPPPPPGPSHGPGSSCEEEYMQALIDWVTTHMAEGLATTVLMGLVPGGPITKSIAHVAGMAATGGVSIATMPENNCPPDPPNGWGDPHLMSLDGLGFDLQSVGEFHLARADALGIDVQARFVPWNGSQNVSVIDRVATEVNGFTVEMDLDNNVWVDGRAYQLEDGAVLYFNGGSALMRDGDSLTILWPHSGSGETAAMQWSRGSIWLRLPPGMPSEGLLGNHDDDPRNDLSLPDGTPLPATATAAQLHGIYADSWRISQNESLFGYHDAEDTATYTDHTFPANVVTIGDFTDEEIEAASAICRAENVQAGPVFEDCVYDVLVTGDSAYAETAAAITGEVWDPLAKTFNAEGTLAEDFTSPVPTNFAYQRYLNDPATSRVAGPMFDTSPYRPYVLDVPRHDTAQLTLDLIAYGPFDTDTHAQSAALTIDDGDPITATLEGASPTLTGAPAGASISRIAQGVTAADGQPFSTYRIEVPITHYGSALKFTATPQGFKSLFDTSMGVNKISVGLGTPPAETFPVLLPATLSPDTPDAGAGRLETPGSEDDYTFTVADDPQYTDQLLVTRSCSQPTKLVLEDIPTSVKLIPTSNSCSSTLFTGLAPDTYRLEVTGAGSATEYETTIYRVPVVQDAGQYVVGEPAKLISTTLMGEDAVMSFAATAGDRVQVETSENTYPGSYGVNWNLQRPDGSMLWSAPQSKWDNAFIDTLTLDQAGTWRVVFDPAGTQVGSIRFAAWSVPEDVDAGAYAVGDPAKTVSTVAPGQGASMTFAATAGDRVQIETSENTYPGSYGVNWNLQRPDGSMLWSAPQSRWDNAFIDTLTLDQAGTWKVVFDPNGVGTGSIDFRAWGVPADVEAGPYLIGDPAMSVATAAAGQNASLAFNATAGQSLQMQTTGSSFTTGVNWNLMRPDGSLLWSAPQSKWDDAAVDTTVLDQSGTWKVVFDPDGTSTGSIDFRAWDVLADVEAGPYVIGDPAMPVATAASGQNASLSFNATAGQRIQLQTSDSTYPIWGVNWNLMRPDGSLLWSAPQSKWDNAAVDTTVLDQSGTWKVVFDPDGTSTGSIDFRAWDVLADVEAGPYVIGDPAAAIATSSGQNATLSFTATAGQQIQMQTTGSTYPMWGVVWNLMRPDGSLLWPAPQAKLDNADVDTTVLDQSGIWKVVFDPDGVSTGSIDFRAWEVPADLDAGLYELGDSAISVATSPGQNATLSFTATEGQQIQMQTSGSTYPRWGVTWNLMRPDGSLLWSIWQAQWDNAAVDTTVLDQSGTWKVVFDPDGLSTGSINFWAWDVL